MWSLFDARDRDKQPVIEWVCNIPVDEAKALISTFHFTSSYNVVQMASKVAEKNGLIFMHHMRPESINAYNQAQVDDIVVVANQQALNYATSIKSFLDWTERELRISNKEIELKEYKLMQNILYDSQVSYRFWLRLRNFLVHCGFPYTSASISENNISIECSKEHLLTYSNWNAVKDDIDKMDDIIQLHEMVPAVNACIHTLYIEFVKLFANEIIAAMNSYSAFCKKYGVNQPMFSELPSPVHIGENGVSLMPLPIDDLMNAFADLKKHPGVNINIR